MSVDEHQADERRLHWDERHRAGDFEGRGPNQTLMAAVSGMATGRALELACGSGTNAVWLAGQGWRTTAVDWSEVGLANGRAKAEAAGVQVDWLQRDLFEWVPPARAFDLVAIVYLHLPEDERNPVYARAAAAVAPGGRLVVVGHDRRHGAEGLGGPDPDRLFTANEIAAELIDNDPELRVERTETMCQEPTPGRAAVDALLVVRRS
jgi:SAM-dependent methyltransferase